jgi:hypothetical protein
MTFRDLQRLLRECATLVALLAMVLGPLALAASRGHGAAEMVAAASGTKPLALCLPGSPDTGPADSAPADTGSGDQCDHCIAGQAFVPPMAGGVARPFRSAAAAVSVASTSLLAAFPRAPPARGPPTA